MTAVVWDVKLCSLVGDGSSRFLQYGITNHQTETFMFVHPNFCSHLTVLCSSTTTNDQTSIILEYCLCLVRQWGFVYPKGKRERAHHKDAELNYKNVLHRVQ
jgi:hypothetical protein